MGGGRSIKNNNIAQFSLELVDGFSEKKVIKDHLPVYRGMVGRGVGVFKKKKEPNHFVKTQKNSLFSI